MYISAVSASIFLMYLVKFKASEFNYHVNWWQSLYESESEEVLDLFQNENNRTKIKEMKKWNFIIFEIIKFATWFGHFYMVFIIPLLMILTGYQNNVIPIHYKIVGLEDDGVFSLIVTLLHQWYAMFTTYQYECIVYYLGFGIIYYPYCVLDALHEFLIYSKLHPTINDDEYKKWLKTVVTMTEQTKE